MTDWLTEEFARARKRLAQLPPHALPVQIRPIGEVRDGV